MGQRGSSEQPTEINDGVSWWMKLLARGVGVVGGLLAMGLGIFACITFSSMCIVAGIVQFLAGFIVILFEAPCCCQFVDFIQHISNFADNRPYWQKAGLYCLIALPGVAMCLEISTIFGSGSLFVSGVLYAMMALGKKADQSTMKLRANGAHDNDMAATLMDEDGHHAPTQQVPTNNIP